MRFSEKRTLAWIVFALVVILSVSLSGGGAIRDMRSATEKIFTSGVNGDGLCIDRDLTVRAQQAAYMADLAKDRGGYEALAKDVAEGAQALLEATSIGEKFAANTALSRSEEQLYTALKAAGISEADRYHDEFISRAHTISLDVYNQRAREFNESISAFPASLIARLNGVKSLELFA